MSQQKSSPIDPRQDTAEELLRNGRYAEAAALFEQTLRAFPTDLGALRGLAEACFGLGDKSGASHYTHLALELQPDDASSLNNAGVLAFHENNYERASQLLTKAVQIDPNLAEAHFNLCSAFARLTLADQTRGVQSDQLIPSLRWISDNAPDPAREELLALNADLRQNLLDRYRNRFANLGARVLLHAPTSNMGALFYIFESWQQGLSFMGIETRLALAGYPIEELMEGFDPNVLISVDTPEVAGTINWNMVYDHLNRHHLSIGLCAEFGARPREADFYVTFHLDPEQDSVLRRVTSPLISLPFAFNPLLHRMSPAQTVFDFAFIGTNSPSKQRETLEYLVPLVRNYAGILGGTGWPGRFDNFIQADAGFLYNFASICPNYHLQAQLDRFSEINERAHIIQACGSFQLSDTPAALRSLYAEDELIAAASPAEFHSLFQHYLQNPQEREPIIRRGMAKAWTSYSQFTTLERLVEHISRRL